MGNSETGNKWTKWGKRGDQKVGLRFRDRSHHLRVMDAPDAGAHLSAEVG